jgi:hypothetical protein
MVSKGNNRLNGRRIQRRPQVDDVSKTESETPEYMRNQRFSEEQIQEMQKKLDAWKKKNNQ